MKDETSDPFRNDFVHGNYANYFKVGYNAFEFIIDFCQCYSENNDEEHPQFRIITNPAYAKTLLEMLQASVDGYEKQFGKIQKDLPADSGEDVHTEEMSKHSRHK